MTEHLRGPVLCETDGPDARMFAKQRLGSRGGREGSVIAFSAVALAFLAGGLGAQPSGAPANPTKSPIPPARALSGSQPATRRPTPRLEPIAETKLLMEGMTHANFRGLERLLSEKPADDQAWKFARGQALLIAESANLLMLRPPRNPGEQAWMENAMDLRSRATSLAKELAGREFEKGRTGLRTLATTCNRCHQTFRVPVEITPFQQAPAPARKADARRSSRDFPFLPKDISVNSE